MKPTTTLRNTIVQILSSVSNVSIIPMDESLLEPFNWDFEANYDIDPSFTYAVDDVRLPFFQETDIGSGIKLSYLSETAKRETVDLYTPDDLRISVFYNPEDDGHYAIVAESQIFIEPLLLVSTRDDPHPALKELIIKQNQSLNDDKLRVENMVDEVNIGYKLHAENLRMNEQLKINAINSLNVHFDNRAQTKIASEIHKLLSSHQSELNEKINSFVDMYLNEKMFAENADVAEMFTQMIQNSQNELDVHDKLSTELRNEHQEMFTNYYNLMSNGNIGIRSKEDLNYELTQLALDTLPTVVDDMESRDIPIEIRNKFKEIHEEMIGYLMYSYNPSDFDNTQLTNDDDTTHTVFANKTIPLSNNTTFSSITNDVEEDMQNQVEYNEPVESEGEIIDQYVPKKPLTTNTALLEKLVREILEKQQQMKTGSNDEIASLVDDLSHAGWDVVSSEYEKTDDLTKFNSDDMKAVLTSYLSDLSNEGIKIQKPVFFANRWEVMNSIDNTYSDSNKMVYDNVMNKKRFMMHTGIKFGFKLPYDFNKRGVTQLFHQEPAITLSVLKGVDGKYYFNSNSIKQYPSAVKSLADISGIFDLNTTIRENFVNIIKNSKTNDVQFSVNEYINFKTSDVKDEVVKFLENNESPDINLGLIRDVLPEVTEILQNMMLETENYFDLNFSIDKTDENHYDVSIALYDRINAINVKEQNTEFTLDSSVDLFSTEYFQLVVLMSSIGFKKFEINI